MDEIERVLSDKSLRQQIVQHNYDVAHEYISYQVLEDELKLMIQPPHNIYRLLGRLKRFLGRELK